MSNDSSKFGKYLCAYLHIYVKKTSKRAIFKLFLKTMLQIQI